MHLDEARLSEISMTNDSQLNPDILKNIHDAKQSERAFESDPELKSQTLSETVESMVIINLFVMTIHGLFLHVYLIFIK